MLCPIADHVGLGAAATSQGSCTQYHPALSLFTTLTLRRSTVGKQFGTQHGVALFIALAFAACLRDLTGRPGPISTSRPSAQPPKLQAPTSADCIYYLNITTKSLASTVAWQAITSYHFQVPEYRQAGPTDSGQTQSTASKRKDMFNVKLLDLFSSKIYGSKGTWRLKKLSSKPSLRVSATATFPP